MYWMELERQRTSFFNKEFKCISNIWDMSSYQFDYNGREFFALKNEGIDKRVIVLKDGEVVISTDGRNYLDADGIHFVKTKTSIFSALTKLAADSISLNFDWSPKRKWKWKTHFLFPDRLCDICIEHLGVKKEIQTYIPFSHTVRIRAEWEDEGVKMITVLACVVFLWALEETQKGMP